MSRLRPGIPWFRLAPYSVGNLFGPGASTDNAIARWNGIAGTDLQNSGVIISDTNAITGALSLSLGTAGSSTGILTFSGSTSGTITIQPAAAAGTYTLTLPVDDGTANQVLTTDGNGILSWAAVSGGAATTEPFVTIGNTAGLSAERALTGTANQIVITDNGVNSTVVLSTPQDLATASSPQFAGLNIGHATDTTITRTGAGDIAIEGNGIYRAGGTDVAVADGGTGVGSWTNGQLLIGNTTGNTAALATLTGTANQITVTNGASSITLATPQNIHTSATPQFAGVTLGDQSAVPASAANVGKIASIEGGGVDSNAILMLHCDNTDGSTAFIDSGATGHVITAVGNAQIDTAQSKFGGSSVLFDGSGDYLTIPDHANFYFDGDFTIDFQIRFNAFPTNDYVGIMSHETDGNNRMTLNFDTRDAVGNSRGIAFGFNAGGAYKPDPNLNSGDGAAWSTNWLVNTWYHVAVVRSGNTWLLFKNGTQVGTSTDATAYPNFTGVFNIGYELQGVKYFNGWLDEIRITKGVARWTSNFTAPTVAYAVDGFNYIDNAGAIASLSDKISGIGSNLYLSKFMSSRTIGNSIIYDNGSNVGISTIAPLVKLAVAGTIESTDMIRAAGWVTGTGTGAGAEIGVSGGISYFSGYNRTTSSYVPTRVVGSTISLRHSDASTDLFINTAGSVGIGVEPSYAFHVQNAADGNYIGHFSNTSSTGHGVFIDADGTGTNALLLRNVVPTNLFYVTTGGVGYLYDTAWTYGPSERRFKKNIRNIEYGLTDLMKLKPVKYDYIDGSGDNRIGLIAEEAETIIPEFVSEIHLDKYGNEKAKGIKVSSTETILIKCIQELLTRVEALETK